MKAKPFSLGEIQGLVSRLQSTLEQLGNAATATKPAPKRRVAAARVARRPAALDKGALQAKIIELLKRAPKGASLSELAEQTKALPEAVKDQLRALRTNRRARTRGKTRAALWFAA